MRPRGLPRAETQRVLTAEHSAAKTGPASPHISPGIHVFLTPAKIAPEVGRAAGARSAITQMVAARRQFITLTKYLPHLGRERSRASKLIPALRQGVRKPAPHCVATAERFLTCCEG